ncbi:MAG: hypothetical protein H7Y17_06835 [Chlorobia bacterium]|nr:hypothetical protein [Fimbriimonadaceae bacterium]
MAEFLSSMVMDHEKWHDGIGYDVHLIDAMTDEQKSAIESKLIAKGVSDWRDLEALDRLGTPGATAAILATRKSKDRELRVRAQSYGPPPSDEDREAAILAGLQSDAGRSKAIDAAANCPTPKIIKGLVECLTKTVGADAYSVVATLFFMHGKMDSPHSMAHRQFFLRFVEPGPDKDAAMAELRQKFKLPS